MKFLAVILLMCLIFISNTSANPLHIRHARNIKSTTQDDKIKSDASTTTTTTVTTTIAPISTTIVDAEYNYKEYPSDETARWSEDYDNLMYPDEDVGEKEKAANEPDQYFTDLSDYNDEEDTGPSFQKLILLAAAKRHNRRSISVPSNAKLTIAII